MKKEDLKTEVKELVDEIDKTHRYSMSKITYLHNKVFDVNHQPKAVASILIRQVQNLKAFIENRDIPNKGIIY